MPSVCTMAHRVKVLPKKRKIRYVLSVNNMEHTESYLEMTAIGKRKDLFSRRKYHQRKRWWKTDESKFSFL